MNSLDSIVEGSLPRAFECDNPPWLQHHGVPRGRVPALSLSFFVHAELTEPADKDILTGGEGAFNNFEKGFGDLR